jgi:hypothetical protein
MHLFRSMGVEQIFEVFPDVQNMMEKKGWLPAIA